MKRDAAPLPTFDQLLEAVPTPNQAVRAELSRATLVLWVPIRRRWWMGAPLGWFFPFKKEKGIALDSVGTQVWSTCDGRRCVEEIVEVFAERHRLRFHEARLSVCQFLKSLVERNLMVLVVRGDGQLPTSGHRPETSVIASQNGAAGS